jgi:hypothetical protein
MDLNQAIQFGLLVNAAEAVLPGTLANAAGQAINISYGPINVDYKVVTTIYGNDLATDTSPEAGKDIVSFGYILQAANNDVVVAIRGTASVWEWVQDAKFLAVKYPYLAGAGLTDDGFTDVYNSLRITDEPAAARVSDYLATFPFNEPVGSLTICGHSLGGALATLLALEVAANTHFKNPAVFTYASPRTGDPTFATTYNQVVPNTFRIANRMDIVPKLPLPPLYEHVLGLYELIPGLKVKLDVVCQHHLTTYLHLLSLATANAVLPLDNGCGPGLGL